MLCERDCAERTFYQVASMNHMAAILVTGWMKSKMALRLGLG